MLKQKHRVAAFWYGFGPIQVLIVFYDLDHRNIVNNKVIEVREFNR